MVFSTPINSVFLLFLLTLFITLLPLGHDVKFILSFLFIFVGFILGVVSGKKLHFSSAFILFFLFLMLVLNFVSLLIGQNKFITDDLYEPLKYIILFIFVLNISILLRNDYKLIEYSLDYYSYFLLLLGFSSFLLPEMSNFYQRDDEILSGKPVLMFFTTYFAGFVYLMFAFYWLRKSFLADKWTYLAYSVSFSFLTLLTQSRTAFLALLVFFVVSFVLSYKFRKFYFALFLILLSFSLIYLDSVLIIVEQFSYIYVGLDRYLFNFFDYVQDSGSLGARYTQLLWALDNNCSIIVGCGIGKSENRYLESFYALYYYRYGLLGLLIYAFAWSIPLFLVNEKNDRVWYFGFLLSLFILSLSSVITDQIYTMHVSYIFLSFIYSQFFLVESDFSFTSLRLSESR